MRIAYTAYVPDARRECGSLKKMVDQMLTWRAAGHEVQFFLLANYANPTWRKLGEIEATVFDCFRPTRLLTMGREMMHRVTEWNPDLVYSRYDFYLPGFQRMASKFPVVGEVNSDDVAERLRSNRAMTRLRGLYVKFTRGRFFRSVDGIVSVTQELADRLEPFRRPCLVAGNAVDLARVRVLDAPNNDHPRILFLGSAIHHWNGAEKLVPLARQFPNWHFDIVGFGPGDIPTPPANFALHGFLARDKYLPLLARADIAFGTLALHWKGMHEASPLKVREYLASGIPTIIGYQDTDFPEPVDFLLQLENTPDNIVRNLDRIESFVREWKGRRVPREAVAHLDIRVKQAAVLDFITKIRNSRANC